MKLEVGMYVRTKWGIVKFLGYCEQDLRSGKIEEFYYEEDDISRTVCLVEDIIKARHNIIDLIEVGDYVNGIRVNEIERNSSDNGTIIKIGNTTFNVLDNEEIYIPCYEQDGTYRKIEKLKSIVTKEQFANIEYKLDDSHE